MERIDNDTKFDLELPMQNIAVFKETDDFCPHFILLDTDSTCGYIPTHNRVVGVKKKLRFFEQADGSIKPGTQLTIKLHGKVYDLYDGCSILSFAKDRLNQIEQKTKMFQAHAKVGKGTQRAEAARNAALEEQLGETFENFSSFWNENSSCTIAELINEEVKLYPLFENLENRMEKLTYADRLAEEKYKKDQEELQQNVKDLFAQR